MSLSNETNLSYRQASERNVWLSLWRGFNMRCPSCGTGALSPSFLKVADSCSHCNEALHHHKADDAPAYFTIMIVGHIVVPLLLWTEIAYKPSYLFHFVTWPLLIIGLSLILLPRIKGALVGLQWANRMHGFNANAPDEDDVAREGTSG